MVLLNVKLMVYLFCMVRMLLWLWVMLEGCVLVMLLVVSSSMMLVVWNFIGFFFGVVGLLRGFLGLLGVLLGKDYRWISGRLLGICGVGWCVVLV